MDLQLTNQYFVIGGASSGLGNAIAELLLAEGAHVLAIARNQEKLEALQARFPGQVSMVAGDITEDATLQAILDQIVGRQVHGALINAGGPPAKTVMETTLQEWDTAYRQVLRWKVALTQQLVPLMQPYSYGRLLFLESASVKQPIENLVLSNSIRMAVVGFVKTFSQELAGSGITFNVIGPGSHNTPAIDRLYAKKSEQLGIPAEQVRQAAIQGSPLRALGEAADFAQLAIWLLSEGSRYVTGQVYLVDGGTVKGT